MNFYCFCSNNFGSSCYFTFIDSSLQSAVCTDLPAVSAAHESPLGLYVHYPSQISCHIRLWLTACVLSQLRRSYHTQTCCSTICFIKLLKIVHSPPAVFLTAFSRFIVNHADSRHLKKYGIGYLRFEFL